MHDMALHMVRTSSWVSNRRFYVTVKTVSIWLGSGFWNNWSIFTLLYFSIQVLPTGLPGSRIRTLDTPNIKGRFWAGSWGNFIYVMSSKLVSLTFVLISNTYHLLGLPCDRFPGGLETMFIFLLLCTVRYILLSSATGQRVGRPRFDSRQGLRIFLFATASIPALGPN
jgi:hypothetical protein